MDDTSTCINALQGEQVLLEPTAPDGRYLDVYFADFLVGRIDVLYGTTKGLTLHPRGNVSHETGLLESREEGLQVTL